MMAITLTAVKTDISGGPPGGRNIQERRFRRQLESLLGVENVRDRTREIKDLKEHSIFLLSLSIETNIRKTVRLSFKDLNFDDPSVRELKRMKAQEIKVPMLLAVEDAQKELTSLKRKSLKGLKYFEPFWYVPEPRRIELIGEIKIILESVPRLREQIAADYKANQSMFRLGLMRVISRRISKPKRPRDPKKLQAYNEAIAARKETIGRILEQKLQIFPSKEDCVAGLQVSVQWGGRIPSLQEQAEMNAKIKRILADEALSELERQRALADAEAEAMTANARREVYSQIVRGSVGEFYKVIAEGLDLVQANIQGAGFNHRKRERIHDAIASLDDLLVYLKEASNLEDLALAKAEIQDLLERSNAGYLDLRSRIDCLREWVKPNLEDASSSDNVGEMIAGNMLI